MKVHRQKGKVLFGMLAADDGVTGVVLMRTARWRSSRWLTVVWGDVGQCWWLRCRVCFCNLSNLYSLGWDEIDHGLWRGDGSTRKCGWWWNRVSSWLGLEFSVYGELDLGFDFFSCLGRGLDGFRQFVLGIWFLGLVLKIGQQKWIG